MDVYEVVVRLLLAILIGGIIGYEREHRNRPAGFRTHILVCLGACVISMIQLYDIKNTSDLILKNPQLSNALKADVGRLGAQVISGIGFLGAGTIIREKGSVKGLTTAASLWVVACIGLAVGLGYYNLSILATIAAVISLVILKKFESTFSEKKNLVRVEIHYIDKQKMIVKMNDCLENKNTKIESIEFLPCTGIDSKVSDNQKGVCIISFLKRKKDNDIVKQLACMDEVTKVTVKQD